jgi:hypothetical protein
LDRQPNYAHVVNRLLRRLERPAQADHVDGITRLHSGESLSLGARLADWIMRMNDHADVRASEIIL